MFPIVVNTVNRLLTLGVYYHCFTRKSVCRELTGSNRRGENKDEMDTSGARKTADIQQENIKVEDSILKGNMNMKVY